jgi:hypothetical protein
MELVVTPAHHAAFYQRALQSIPSGNGAPRVLISGAADYSMLAHVLAIYRERGVEPAVTVVDRCDTALYLNRWYAEHASAAVECSRSDILEYTASAPFDAVCTHSFLGQFVPDERIRLLTKWRQLLRPGGAVITANKVRATAGAEPAGFSPGQAQSFRAAVLHKAAALRAIWQADPAEIVLEAEVYMNELRPWPVRSREEIRQLFEACGLKVVELSDATHAPAAGRQTGASASPGSGDGVQIIATRL